MHFQFCFFKTAKNAFTKGQSFARLFILYMAERYSSALVLSPCKTHVELKKSAAAPMNFVIAAQLKWQLSLLFIELKTNEELSCAAAGAPVRFC